MEVLRKWYRTNHILIPYGSDFAYSSYNDYNHPFSESDQLIKLINEKYGNQLIAYYSTPNCYIKSLNKFEYKWPFRDQADFFPYVTIDYGFSFWVGYYTSRPLFKYIVGHANSILQASRQLLVLSNLNAKRYMIEPLMAQVAIAVHHDAITGTSKESVVQDYTRKLLAALRMTNDAIIYSHLKLLDSCHPKKASSPLDINMNDLKRNHVDQSDIDNSCCSMSRNNTIITIYNPLSYGYKYVVRLPIISFEGKIVSSSKEEIITQVINYDNLIKLIKLLAATII